MAKNKKGFKSFFKQNFLLISGLVLILIFAGWRYHQTRILSFSQDTTHFLTPPSEAVKPTHIKSYPVGVDVDIKPAQVVDGVWPVFPNEAGYLINGKNLIIYGHNKNQIMGPIRYVKEGSEITISASNGQDYLYSVVKTDTIEPDNLIYLEQTDEETLTVYTCTGFLDSKRFIVVAKRIN